MLFSEEPTWLAHNPVLRRAAVKVWRALLRMQRATLATAICVLRNSEGQILVAPAPNGELKLPAIPIDGWLNVHAQVEEWLRERVRLPPQPTLVCINGTPSRTGITFLFAATVETRSVIKEERWVDPELIALPLSDIDPCLIRSGDQQSALK
jgi:hypothetical protein